MIGSNRHISHLNLNMSFLTSVEGYVLSTAKLVRVRRKGIYGWNGLLN